MEKIHYISNDQLTFDRIDQIIKEDFKLALSEESKNNITKCREYLDRKMESNDEPIYGINTGFGALCDKKISREDLGSLQKNLVMSHACGTGDYVPQDIVKLMLFLKIQSLSYGHSGVQLETVNRLIDFYNNDVLPVVYTQGSLGASGDLAPLAHLALPLIGKGEVWYKDKVVSAAEICQKYDWQPIQMQSKEGLALLNGTQFMSAYGIHILLKSYRLSYFADLIGAISLDAFDGRIEPFFPQLHAVRPHKGQIETARNVKAILEGSELITREKKHVQDPYSFRCVPQVHGAIKDAINYVANVVLTEINSVTDNPMVFPEDDLIVSGGNFHGEPLALAMDFLSIAMSEIGSISERRTYRLISGERGLPEFLVANPGLNSGFMIPQYSAASIVSLNKQMATPSSVDSIPSSNEQEDHVSMGGNAATKALKIAQNVERVLAMELFNSAQAMEFRRPAKTSPFLEDFLAQYRQYVGFVKEDKIMYKEIEKSVEFLQNGEFGEFGE